MSNQLRREYYTLIPRIDAHKQATPRLLLRNHGDTYQLPHFSATETRFWQTVDHVNTAIYELLGIRVTTLRCMQNVYIEATNSLQLIYALEPHDSDWQPPTNALWVSRDELAGISLEPPESRAWINAWFDWMAETARQDAYVPWYKLGWSHDATSWIERHVNDSGQHLLSPPQQMRSWNAPRCGVGRPLAVPSTSRRYRPCSAMNLS